MFLVSKCSIQSYFDVFLLQHPWQRQFPVLVPRRYDVMPSDDVMILAPARLWCHTFRAVFSCSFFPTEFISFIFTTWLCEQHSHIVCMVPCQVNRCFIIQYITRQNHIYMIYPTPTKNLDLLGVQILQKLHLAVFVGMCMQYAYPGVNLHLLRPVYPSYRETTDIYICKPEIIRSV